MRCRKSVREFRDVPTRELGGAGDGWGVACSALPLRNRPLAYPRLDGPVLEAMTLHPELVAGEGRPCTEMMRAHPGRVVAKVGAEGVYSALLVREGLGVTLKVEDGHSLASALAIASVLAELGLKPQPASLLKKPITNSRGDTVGEMRVNGGLSRGNACGVWPAACYCESRSADPSLGADRCRYGNGRRGEAARPDDRGAGAASGDRASCRRRCVRQDPGETRVGFEATRAVYAGGDRDVKCSTTTPRSPSRCLAYGVNQRGRRRGASHGRNGSHKGPRAEALGNVG